MKILFVAQNFQMGGIQKSLINVVKFLDNNAPHINIHIFSFGKGDLIKEIPKNVHITYGNVLLQLISTPFFTVKQQGVMKVFLRIICMLIVRIIGSANLYKLLFLIQKQKFKEYDVAVSYFNDVTKTKSYFNKGTNLFVDKFVDAKRKLAWIHTDPIKAGFNYEETLTLYKRFDRLICVSEASKDKFIEFIPEFKSKTAVINNLFPIDEIVICSKEYKAFTKRENIIDIISVGRIDDSTKNFNIIPEICKRLREIGITNFRWKIVGAGPDLAKNKQLIADLGVEDLVEFIGEKNNPYPFIMDSDIFVLTSIYEGYPMVVGEAHILNTPVVSTNYAAVNEQITNEFNGLIVKNSEDLFEKIRELLLNNVNIEYFKRNLGSEPFTNFRAEEQLKMELRYAENKV
jgi:glycosyltransferase involved in cell wall biosynthesis